MQHRERYESDVSDRNGELSGSFCPSGAAWVGHHVMNGEVFNAIMYVTKTGCP